MEARSVGEWSVLPGAIDLPPIVIQKKRLAPSIGSVPVLGSESSGRSRLPLSLLRQCGATAELGFVGSNEIFEGLRCVTANSILLAYPWVHKFSLGPPSVAQARPAIRGYRPQDTTAPSPPQTAAGEGRRRGQLQ